MSLQYKELLQLARQKLTPSEDANSSEPMDKNLMLRDGLMSKKSKDEEAQPSVDNMSNIYKKVINYNNELKNEVASYEDTLPTGEAAGMVLVDDKPKVDFKVSQTHFWHRFFCSGTVISIQVKSRVDICVNPFCWQIFHSVSYRISANSFLI